MRLHRKLATKRKEGEFLGFSMSNSIVFSRRIGFNRIYGATYYEECSGEVREFSKKEDIAMLMQIGMKVDKEFNFAKFIAIAMVLLSIICGSNNQILTVAIATSFYVCQKNFVNMILSEVLNINGSQRLSRNHAAEHMVENVYEVLGKIPTIEEAKTGSMFHIRCGNNQSYKMCFEMILSTIILNVTSIVAPSLEGYEVIFMMVSILIIELLDRKLYIFRYAGIVELRKPTDLELNMAISALRIAEESYKDYEKRFRNGEFWVILF